MSADNIILNEAGGTDVPVVSADCRVLRLFVLIIGSDFFICMNFYKYTNLICLSQQIHGLSCKRLSFCQHTIRWTDKKMPDMVN